MAKGQSPFEVTCPCCGARLTLDGALKAVVHHEPPPRSGSAGDLGQAFQALQGEAARREARFREAAEAEKGKEKLLERKFKEGLKRAKDAPPPPRPFDLD